MVDDISDSFIARARGALLRVAWMAAVPFALVCVFLLIAEHATQTRDVYDIAVAVLMGLAIAARAVDALYFRRTTARSGPTTCSHVIGYAARLVPILAVAWLLARAGVP